MTKRLKIEKGSGNVFFDVGFPPGEAQNLLMRAELMLSIEQFVRKSGMTQKDRLRAHSALPSRDSICCSSTGSSFSVSMPW